MEDKNIISVQQICLIYDIPDSFINSLTEFELIELIDDKFIHENQIRNIEKLMRLHYDLKINFEGLDVIANLLDKISKMESKLIEANNELAFYRHSLL